MYVYVVNSNEKQSKSRMMKVLVGPTKEGNKKLSITDRRSTRSNRIPSRELANRVAFWLLEWRVALYASTKERVIHRKYINFFSPPPLCPFCLPLLVGWNPSIAPMIASCCLVLLDVGPCPSPKKRWIASLEKRTKFSVCIHVCLDVQYPKNTDWIVPRRPFSNVLSRKDA